MNILKTGILLLACMGNLPLAAFPLKSYIPYILTVGTTVYSGYKLYGSKGGNLNNVPLEEGLPYAAVGLATLYGCYNLGAHNASSKELEGKLENAQEAVTQVSLAHLKSSIEELEKKYDVALLNGKALDIPDDSLALYQVLCNRLKMGTTLLSLEKSLKDDLNSVRVCKNTLEVTTQDETHTTNGYEANEQAPFTALRQKLLYNAEMLSSYINKLSMAFREHKQFFLLEKTVSESACYEYAEERKIITTYSGNLRTITECLERYVTSKYSAVNQQFPLIFYVEQLDKQRAALDSILRSLEYYKPFPFQMSVIEAARNHREFLHFLVDHMVSTDSYKYQKAQKPLFDRNEEVHKQQLHERKRLLDQALYERQAAVENERKKVESEVLKRTSEAQAVDNQRRLIEQAAKDRKLEKQKINLQREALQSGQAVREALEKKDQEWLAICKELRAKVKSSEQTQQDYDNLALSVQKERNEWKASKAAIQNELSQFEEAFDAPPAVCAEDNSSVANYLGLLRRHLGAVQQALSLSK